MNATPRLAPLPAAPAAPRFARLTLIVLGALLAGPLAALALDGNRIALALVGSGTLLLALAAVGLRGLDLGLLAVDLAALAFFTAIRHRTAGELGRASCRERVYGPV